MRAAYIGYDIFSNVLSALIDEKIDIVRCYSLEEEDDWNKREIVSSLCKENSINISFERPDKNDIEILRDEHGIDHVFIAAIPYKVPIVGGVRFINFHPSYLPLGRGTWPIPYYLLGRSDCCGVTLHEAVSEMDAGPIIIQKKIQVEEVDNYETIVAKCQIFFEDCLRQYLREPDQLWTGRQAQVDGFTLPFPSDEIQELNWEKSVYDLRRTLRAFGKNEVSASWDGKRWLVSSASTCSVAHSIQPGKIISKFHGNVVIAALDGIVVIHSFREETQDAN